MPHSIPALSTKLREFFQSKIAIGVVAGIVIIFIGYLIFGGSSAKQDTLVVHPGSFLQQVSVSGTVKASQDVDLAFSQGGRIGSVSAVVGSGVYAGQVLAEVENGDIRAQVLQKQASLESAQSKLATLQAGTRPEEIALAQAAVAQDQTAVINAINTAYTVVDDAIHNKTDEIFSNPRTLPQLNFSISNAQLKTNIETGRAALESTLVAWQQKINGSTVTDLSASVALAQQNLAIVSQHLILVNNALNSSLSTPSISQATLNSYTSDAGIARANVNGTINALAAAVSALDGATRSLTLKQAGTTQTDIDVQAALVKAAQADLANMQAQLAKTLIVAPFSGIVTKVDAKVGQTAGANTALISLISVGTYQIESYVPEVNIALVKVGDRATVTLDAYGAGVPFEAQLISIDPASQIRDGVSTYRSILQFKKVDSRIRSGMTANVVITTDERQGVFTVPQKIVQTEGNTSYVFVKENNKNAKRIVTTGSVSSMGTMEITSGLKDGDVVVLSQ